MKTIIKAKVTIFGESYVLVSDQSVEHVQDAALAVDVLMRSIAEKTGLSDSKRIAVLAAMQLASQLKMAEESLKDLEEKELQLVHRIDRELGEISSKAH